MDIRFEEVCQWTDRQQEATIAADAHRYTLYGGAMGGGKSYWLRWYAMRYLWHCALYWGLKGVRVMLACEDYPSLHDRHLSKIDYEWPDTWGVYNAQMHEFRLDEGLGSGVVCFRNLSEPKKYHSAEFALIAVDELTMNRQEIFDILRTRNRWPGVDNPKFIAGSNPGNVGHLWVKRLWMDGDLPEELKGQEGQFVFVPARARDNPHLPQSYYDELDTLPEAMRRAYVDGDWDIFAGQVFSEWRREEHVVQPFMIPAGWPVWRCVDWGYAQPWCCLWLSSDPDSGRVYVYREAYQRELTDRAQAREIMRMTTGAEQIRWTLADPSMWTRKTFQNETFTSADEYRSEGVVLTPADNDRLQGVRKVHQLLTERDEGKPLLQIFSTSVNLIRTLPALPYDDVRLEDVDTGAEDHAYDALRYGLMRGRQKPRAKQRKVVDPYGFIQ